MTRRNILIISLFLLLSEATARQIADSLQRVSETTPPNRAYIDSLLEHSQSLYNVDLKGSLARAEEALSQADQIDYNMGIQRALSILSRIQRRLGNFSVAINYSLRELSVAVNRKDTVGMIDSYTTLGNIYSSLENYTEAKKNLFMGYSIAQSAHASTLASIMNFIGRNFGKMHQYDSAEHWILKSLDQETKVPQKGYSLSYIYNNLAEVYYHQKKYNLAIKNYLLSRKLPEDKKSPFGKTFTLNGLALTYKDLKRYPAAIQAAEESIKISKQFSYRDRTKESYGILHEIYEELGDYKNALENYKQFNLYQDSIFSEDNLKHIENLKIQYETEQVTTENQLLRKDTELKDTRLSQQKNLFMAAVFASLLLIGGILFLFYGYWQKKKTNLLLEKYNKDLGTQVEEQTQELVKTNHELIRQNSQLEQYGYLTAHNLRAPVARILGLTDILKTTSFDPDKDTHILDKVHHTATELDAIIHDMNAILDVKNGIENSYEIVDFHERLEKIRSILKESIAHTKTVIVEDFYTVKSCVSIPAYIESIFYNLISNAIKYRSPNRNPEIKISSRMKEGKLELIISDNGMGIDLNQWKDKIFNLYQRFHDHVEGKGIGLFLVKTQVESLNGNINIESTVNKGTTFQIILPVV